MPCYVSARFTAKPGQGDALFQLISRIIPTVRAEDGCIRYDLHRGMGKPEEFFFYETWASPAALKVHGESAHMAAFHYDSKALMADAGVVEVWEAADVKS